MQALFEFLRDNPFLLLFLTVGLAVWVGRFSVKGYGLGMVAAAVATSPRAPGSPAPKRTPRRRPIHTVVQASRP